MKSYRHMLHTTYDTARLFQNEMLCDTDSKGLKERVKIFQKNEIYPFILATTDLRLFTSLIIVSVLWKIAI